MAFDPNKKNSTGFQQGVPPYTNPYAPPSVPQQKGTGIGIKIAIFAIITMFLVVGGVGLSLYLHSMKGSSVEVDSVDNQSSGSDSVVEVEIFN